VGHPAIRWRIGVYGRTVFFLGVFVNNDRARHVYKAFGFRKRGNHARSVGLQGGRLCRSPWASLLLLAIHSGVPGILSTETGKKKLAEEG
jgi:hypothetical protein